MRVDNKIEIYDYLGSPLGRIEFDELLLAGEEREDSVCGGLSDWAESDSAGGLTCPRL